MLLYLRNTISSILNSKKDLTVESLRGLALILMIMGHVIGETGKEGMRLDDDSIYRYIYYSLMYIRMPLFTAISGYVYSLRPITKESRKIFNFYKGKGNRLLFPLVFVSTIHYLFQVYIPGVNSPEQLAGIWKIYIYPYEHYWYLQALLIVFIIIGIIDYLGLINKLYNWLLIISLSIVAQQFLKISNLFSLNEALYLLPFFLLGCGIKRYENTILHNKYIISTVLILFLAGIGFQQYGWFARVDFLHNRYNIVAIFIGIFALIILFRIRFYSPFLTVIGYFSYGVYLLHVFGTASSRMLMEFYHIDRPKIVIFLVGIISGIAVPIIMELFIVRSRLLRRFLLGRK